MYNNCFCLITDFFLTGLAFSIYPVYDWKLLIVFLWTIRFNESFFLLEYKISDYSQSPNLSNRLDIQIKREAYSQLVLLLL